jgi:LysR family hydrogen peroxide-inducible transcriptional activator
MIPTIAPYLLPRIVPLLAKRHGALELQVRETITERLVDELDKGELDTIIAAAPIGAAGFASRHIARDRFFIAAASNSDDVIPSPAAPDAMATERLLLLDEGHCLRDQALAACQMNADRRMTNFGATSLTTVLQMVANGMGLTLIPEMAVKAENCAVRGITLSRFTAPEPSREIGLYWRPSSGLDSAMDAFGDIVAEVMPSLADADLTAL